MFLDLTALHLTLCIALAGHDEFTIRERAGNTMRALATTEATWRQLREAYRNTEDAEVRHRILPALRANENRLLDAMLPAWQAAWFDIDRVADRAGELSWLEVAKLRDAFYVDRRPRDDDDGRLTQPDLMYSFHADYRYAARAWAAHMLAFTGDLEKTRAAVLAACENDRAVVNKMWKPTTETLAEVKKNHPTLLNKGYQP